MQTDQVVSLETITKPCRVRVESAPEGWEHTKGNAYDMFLRNNLVDFLSTDLGSAESIPPGDVPGFQVTVVPKT